MSSSRSVVLTRLATFVLLPALAPLSLASLASAQAVGAEVVSYVNPTEVAFGNSAAAVGLPTRSELGSDITIFGGAFLNTDIVRVQPGGTIALRLSQPVVVSASRTLGVISNVGIIDGSDDGSGVAVGSAPFTFSAAPVANVSVSSDGASYFPIGAGLTSFTMPSTGYLNTPAWTNYTPAGGTVESDFFKPTPSAVQDAGIASFASASYAQSIALLEGSGGGTWLSLASSGLSSVSYVKFDVPSDAPAGSRFILDGVVGIALPEPTSIAMIGCVGAVALRRRRE